MKKMSKRCLAAVLSILMILTSFPLSSITASAVSTDDGVNYLFAYFTGDASASSSNTYTQAVRFATSQDSRNFNALNNNDSVITQTKGSRSCRDPYIFLGEDGYYYCVVTDLDASTMGYWGTQPGIIFWRSSDLVNWKKQTRINIAEICGLQDSEVYRFWAPQVIWDENYNNGQGAYMVYFGLAANGYSAGGTKMHYMYTTDLLDQSKYTAPQPLMKNNAEKDRDSIDGDITYYNGTYYMFYKDENQGTICIVKSDTINGPYDTDNIIVLSHSAMGNLEGCQVWWSEDIGEYIFMADRYSNQGVFAVYEIGSNLDAFYDAVSANNDISNYYNSSSSASLSAVHPRHGSVIEINDAQYTKLSRATFNSDIELPSSGSGVNLAANLVARYLVDDATTDETNNGYDLTQNGTVTWSANQFGEEGAAYFTNGNYLYNDDVQSMLANNNNAGFTVSFLGKVDSSCASTGRFVSMSNFAPASYSWVGNGTDNGNSLFDFYNDNKWEGMYHYYDWWQYDDGTAGGRYSTATAPLKTNTWHLYTITFVPDGGNGGTISIYNDGDLLYSQWSYANRAAAISEFTYFMLGATAYNDTTFTGYMRDVRVYNRAITEAEVEKLPRQYAIDMEDSGIPGGSDLRSAVTAFEDAVKEIATNGYTSLYTHLVPAYEAYKVANAVLAGTSSVSSADALADLNEALADMKKFKAHTGSATPTIGSSTVESDYYSNVIYTEPAYENSQGQLYDGFNDDVKTILNESYASAWVYGSHVYMYYPNSVIMYDGTNDATIPTVIGFINKDHRYSLNMLYYGEEMDNFTLSKEWWQGYNDSQSFMWPSNSGNTIPTDTTNTSENTNAETINHDASNDTTTYRLHKNGIKYVGTPTSGYTCFSSTTWLMKGQYNYAWSDQQIEGVLTNAVPDIDVINYKMLIDALMSTSNNSDYRTYLASIDTAFTAGGLEKIFAAFDAATTLNPNEGCTYFDHEYDYADDMDAAALQCGNDIDKAVEMLGKVNISAETVDYQKLVKAINKYETTMASMSGVYTNLEDAYEKYLLAVEYRDAFDYGSRTGSQFTNPTLSEAAQQLLDAISNMQPYTKPSTLSSGIKYYDDGSDISSDYYNNVVYWGNTSTIDFNISNNKNKYPSGFTVYCYPNNSSEAAAAWPNTVLLYTGSDDRPEFPVFGATKRSTSKDRQVYYFYPVAAQNSTTKSSDFELTGEWHGERQHDYSGSSDIPASWNTAYGYPARSNYQKGNLGNTTYIMGFQGSGYYHSSIAANILRYTGTPNTSNYYEAITTTWVANIGSAGKNNYGDYNNYETGNDVAYATASKPIYVINYETVKNKINTITINEGDFDVSNYTEGGLDNWFKQIDALTSFNPNTYFTSTTDSTTAADVTTCANAIKALVETTTSGMPTSITDSSITADTLNVPNEELYDASGNLKDIDDVTGSYSKLKVAILEAETAPTEQGCIKSQYWNGYETALSNAKTAAYAIATDKSGTSTGKEGYTGSDIEDIAEALDGAISDLYVVANSSHPLKFSYQEKGTHNGYFQCCSNNAHVLDAETGDTVIQADMTAYDALDRVYYTLDKTKYGNLTTLELGRDSFEEVKTEDYPAGTTPMQIVNAGITDLLTAINESNTGTIEEQEIAKRHSVSFNVYTIDGDDTTDTKDSAVLRHTDTTSFANVSYGTVALLDLTSSAVLSDLSSVGITADNLVINDVRINNIKTTIPKGDKSVSVYVQDDTTVNIYVTVPKQAEKQYITINSIGGRALYTVEVESTDNVSFDISKPNEITINSKTYTVPESLTYKIAGFTLMGGYYDCGESINCTVAELIEASGDSNLTFRPKAVLNKSDSDKYTFKMDNVVIAEDVKYDYRLRVSSSFVDTADEYAYAIVFYNSDNDIFVPVTYISENSNSYAFYANRDMNFYTLTYKKAAEGVEAGYYLKVNGLEGDDLRITDEDLIFHLDYKMPMVYSYSEITGDDLGSKTEGGVTTYYSNKWTTRSAFSANVGGSELYGDVTITECGTLRTTDAIKYSELVVENVGRSGYNIKQIVATSRDPESNQYSYTLSTKDTTTDRTVYTRAYVKYSYVYNNTKIDAVAYGPVCESYYGDHR